MNQKTTKQKLPGKRPSPEEEVTGRLLPRAVEFEEAVLGALMLEKTAYELIENILRPESFYDEANGIIFAAIAGLRNTRRPVDMLTVVEYLRGSGELEAAGGVSRISDMGMKITGSSNIEYHARIIAQKHLARQLIALAVEIQDRAFDETEDVLDTIGFMEEKFTEISVSRSVTESIGMNEAVHAAIEKAAKIQQETQSGQITAIPTGIDSLTQDLHGGWRSPDLIVVAGRPSMGKTQFAVHFAKCAALSGKEVFFASLEMSATQLANRLLLEDDRISAHNLFTGQMSNEEWEALDKRAGEIWNLKIHIADDDPGIRYLDAICSEARRLKRKGKLDLVIVDYLGRILVRNRKAAERRQIEIGWMTSTLKSLAKELEVPVILLSQLKRPESGFAVKEPKMDDLRESGDIEQDADIILLLHRPSYYDVENEQPEWNEKGKIIIGKYREGARNYSIIFQHDRNFKKIWGNSGETVIKIPPKKNKSARYSKSGIDDELPF